MGNHEYCTECGESDYHYGYPCDPVKKAKHKAEQKACEDRADRKKVKVKEMVAKIKKAFPSIPIKIDYSGHAEIKWWDC